MIKEALQYIVELGSVNVYSVNGNKYSDKPLHRIDMYYAKAEPIEMHTLTSLVDYIKANVDTMEEKMIIDVKSPTEVSLYSQLDPNRDREVMVNVRARIPEFTFNSFMSQEKFCINLQSGFINDSETDRALVLKFSGTVEAGTIAEYGDNGFTQKATVKTGLASKGDAIVPNPVTLRPYRTFLEVKQPASDFIFRMRQGKYEGIECAIFEADGGAWKVAATKAVKEYLQSELSGVKTPNITVIA